MKIFKYTLPFMEVATIEMPKGAKVIRCDGLDGFLFVWAIVDPEAEKEIRTFHLFKTGAEMPKDIIESYDYLGCGAIFIQMELMIYIFESKS